MAKIIYIILGGLILLSNPSDPDFGWHYKYGEYIVQNREIPKINIFSYTMPDYEWANSYWVSDVILFVLHSTLGALGMSLVLGVTLSTVAYWIIDRTALSKNSKVISFLTLIVVCSFFSISVRPLLFSTIFLLLLIYALLIDKSKIKFLPLLFLVWANMHADWTLGLFILGIYTLTEFAKNRNISQLIVPALSAVATLVNPYGIFLWMTLIKESNPTQFRTIAEWTPFDATISAQNPYSVLFIVFSLAMAIYILVLATSWKKYPIWLTLSSIFFMVLSIRAKYFFRAATLLMIFPLAEILSSAIEDTWNRIPNEIRTKIVKMRLFFAFLAILVITEMVLVVSTKQTYYPEDAVVYIKNTKPSGNLFNSYNWGGYLIWKLPEYKTFIDGRMPSWRNNGEFLLEDYLKITKQPEENEELLKTYFNKYNIQVVLIEKESPLFTYLLEDTWGRDIFPQDDKVGLLIKSEL